ncbi:MAG: AAA family ATPase [Oscillospiraceae bacterium]|nr:AAA family ATPase [Oscillospiraceae bacterium]
MLQRKIYKQIEAFYKTKPDKALMIVGARQVGKSYIVEEFCKAHYESLIKMDFIENPAYVSAFAGAESAEEILLRLSALFGDRMIPGRTMIFFDEVQECRSLITQIKYLVQDGTYDYILSGSLLGAVFRDIVSAPVGYMDIIQMYPLDFEEFAIANGVGANVMAALRKAFEAKTPVDAYMSSAEAMSSRSTGLLITRSICSCSCRRRNCRRRSCLKQISPIWGTRSERLISCHRFARICHRGSDRKTGIVN